MKDAVGIHELAYGLVHSDTWDELIYPMLEASGTDVLEQAIVSPNMEELSRNQGWKACLDWITEEITSLAAEHEEREADAS